MAFASRAALPALLAFEWRFHTRRLSFAATILLLACIPLTTVATGFGPRALAVNSPYIVAETTALLTLVSVFALPILCVSAAVRDDEHRMRDLVAATPMPRGSLLGVRFAGVVLAALAALAVATLLLATLPFAVPVREGRLLPLRAAPYLWTYLLFVVPNTLLCAGLLYLVGAWTRSTLATFVAAIGIYAGYFVTALLVDSPLMAGARPATPELLAWAARLDPFGLSAFFEQSRYWTPAESNARLPQLTGHLLWNRVGVLVLAAACVLPLRWLDGRATHGRRRRGGAPATLGGATAGSTTPTAVTGARTAFDRVTPTAAGARTLFVATWSVLRLEVVHLLRSWPLRVLLVLWVVMIGIEGHEQLGGGEYGTRLLASSARLADAVPEALWLIGTICALYFATEVVWREHLLRLDGIRDATPVRNAALLLGKLGALLLVPVLLTVAGFGAVMVVHLTQDGLPVEWRVYGAHALTSLVPLGITTVVAVALQLVVGNRWVALVLGLVVAIIARAGDLIGLAHPLLRFGAAPTLRWSDLDGFGAPLPSWIAFNALWLLGACVLLGMAAALWPRGTTLPWSARLRGVPRAMRDGLSPRGRLVLAGTTVVFAGAYAAMVWQTVFVARWEPERAAIAWRADYERSYRHLAGRAQPEVVHAALDVALFPERRRATVEGALVVENRHDVAIDTLWVMLPQEVQAPSVSWRTATSRHDARFGVTTLALRTPLAPGARDTLRFALTLDRGGLRADGFQQDVAGNGSYVRSTTFMPVFGYQPRFELSDEDAEQRRQAGLGAPSRRVAPASAGDSLAAIAHARGAEPAWLTLDITVSTSADQRAVAPGDLVRSWQAGGRTHARYTMTRPSTPYFSLASGRYAIAEATQGGVRVELWHHALHGVQARRIVDIAATSLATLQPLFGPYPHRTLRIVEVPASWGFGAYASNSVLFLTESRGMLSDARPGDVDLLVRRIGHEVAHEWWGHVVDPLPMEGSLLLVESLAKYSEQLLIAQAQGGAGVARMMAFDHDRYLRGRANTTGLEPTLRTMVGEDHLYYGKGALAFHAMRDLLGDSAIVGALRTLLATEGGPRGAARADAFVAQLRAAAPDSVARAEIDEWFTDRVVYAMVADTTPGSHGVVPAAGGVRVSARFAVTRVRTDSTAAGIVEQRLPADGRQVTVAITADSAGTPVTLARLVRRVANGVVVVDTSIAAPRGALWATIDPDYRRIDADRSDNRVRLRE